MVFDIIVLALTALGLVTGLIKGLVKEALGLIGLILSFLIAKLFAPSLSEYMLTFVKWAEQVRYLVSWILIFIAVALITSMLAYLITKAVQAIQLGFLNRLLGAIFGAMKYILIVSLLFNLYNIINEYVPLPGEDEKKSSKLYELTTDFAPILYNSGKDVLKNDMFIKTDSIENNIIEKIKKEK